MWLVEAIYDDRYEVVAVCLSWKRTARWFQRTKSEHRGKPGFLCVRIRKPSR